MKSKINIIFLLFFAVIITACEKSNNNSKPKKLDAAQIGDSKPSIELKSVTDRKISINGTNYNACLPNYFIKNSTSEKIIIPGFFHAFKKDGSYVEIFASESGEEKEIHPKQSIELDLNLIASNKISLWLEIGSSLNYKCSDLKVIYGKTLHNLSSKIPGIKFDDPSNMTPDETLKLGDALVDQINLRKTKVNSEPKLLQNTKTWEIGCNQHGMQDTRPGGIFTEITSGKIRSLNWDFGFDLAVGEKNGLMAASKENKIWDLKSGEVINKESNGDYMMAYRVTPNDFFKTVFIKFKNGNPFSFMQYVDDAFFVGKCEVYK